MLQRWSLVFIFWDLSCYRDLLRYLLNEVRRSPHFYCIPILEPGTKREDGSSVISEKRNDSDSLKNWKELKILECKTLFSHLSLSLSVSAWVKVHFSQPDLLSLSVQWELVPIMAAGISSYGGKWESSILWAHSSRTNWGLGTLKRW